MNAVIIIPARYDAKRLPGKPLLDGTGKTLIEHVYRRALEARLASDVLVATDDERIALAVAAFGGRCVMTSRNCPSGTDRVAEVVRGLIPAPEAIVNLQGDEPEMDPDYIDTVIRSLAEDGTADIATLAAPVTDPARYSPPQAVKVVTDPDGYALYFSRAPIPFPREDAPEYLIHIGLYAYRPAALRRLASLSPTPLERKEGLEQLRALEHHMRIRVAIVTRETHGIDTPGDYEAFVRRMNP
ncbi:MAG: 3-deoxy-manno-octulosonate cytidylyltransferase [Planctomycetota bacterium]